MVNAQQTKQLKDFFSACNEMIDGRFILSDIKIAKILNAIAESSIIYDLISKCLINFNYDLELRNAKTNNRVNGGYFKMPNEEHKIIALVFCMLLDTEHKKLNLQQFITDNFYSPQGYNISYSNFAMVMLIPFKNSIMHQLNCKEDGTMLENTEEQVLESQIKMELPPTQKEISDAKQKLHFANLRVALTELVAALKTSNKIKVDQKEELLIVSNAIADAIKHENIKYISALVIAFQYAFKNNRSLRPVYHKFLNAFIALINE